MNEKCKSSIWADWWVGAVPYGMNSMSDALQKAAGEKMKKILEFLTKNPIMGALAGAWLRLCYRAVRQLPLWSSAL